MFRKLLVIFMLLIIISITAFGQDQCNEPPTPGSPGGDAGDDNVSFSSGNTTQYSIDSKCLIYMNGYFKEADALIGGNYFIGSNSAEQLLKVSPVIIIPSGGLFGMENDTSFKIILQEYARQGGTIIVFGQQYGSHVDKVVPIPEGENLKSYGWREDQSCWSASAYLNTIHPAISSWVTFWTVLGSFITDGYIESYPSNSTVLLKRTKNQKPFLLYYPYGNGTVILTSMFTDWTYAHSQATGLELNIIRDLITFARNPNKPIAMFDLSKTSYPTISLNVNVRNNAEQQATKVKYFAYNPNRSKIFYQGESGIALNSQEEIEVPVSFRLQNYENNRDYGICHVDYELYDAENNLIQPASESDGGRFALHGGIQPYTPAKGYDVWITAKTENLEEPSGSRLNNKH